MATVSCGTCRAGRGAVGCEWLRVGSAVFAPPVEHVMRGPGCNYLCRACACTARTVCVAVCLYVRRGSTWDVVQP
eukprot:7295491-Prymnesium_polylepis.1